MPFLTPTATRGCREAFPPTIACLVGLGLWLYQPSVHVRQMHARVAIVTSHPSPFILSACFATLGLGTSYRVVNSRSAMFCVNRSTSGRVWLFTTHGRSCNKERLEAAMAALRFLATWVCEDQTE